MPLTLGDRAHAGDNTAGRVDPDLGAVEHANAQDVAVSARPGPDYLGKGDDADAHQLALGALFGLLPAQGRIIDRGQHFIEAFGITAAVDFPAEAGLIGKLSGLDKVAQTDLGLVHIELLSQHIHHPLD